MGRFVVSFLAQVRLAGLVWFCSLRALQAMTDISKIVPGQRWVSETEPELGLGIMLNVEFKRVEVMFPAVNERRQYALQSAPLRRVMLKAGESLETHSGDVLEVDEVLEIDHLLVYFCGAQEVGKLAFQTP